MAKKDKETQKLRQIYKAGDKFHCAQCGSEVNFGNDCPSCNVKIDWAQLRDDVRRF